MKEILFNCYIYSFLFQKKHGNFYRFALGLIRCSHSIASNNLCLLQVDLSVLEKKKIPYLEPSIPFGNCSAIALGDWVSQIYREGKSKVESEIKIDIADFIITYLYRLGDHLFAITGKKWRNLRVKLTPTFTSGKLKAMFQTLADCGIVLEKYIENIAETKEASDIKEILGCYSTDIIGSCAFGLDCNSFKEPNSPFRVYGKRVFVRNTLDHMKDLFSLTFPKVARALHLRVLSKEVSDFFMKTVENIVAYREKNSYTRKDFLQLLIEIKNKNGQPNGHKGDGTTLTMDEVAAQCFIFFLAGFETSSSTTTFALYLLTRHPEIQDKLREEIHTVLERYDDQITYDSLSEMKYMKQVIDESLRLYPPLPFLQRVSQEDYKIPGEDVIIEKGTPVFIPVIGYHHDEQYFSNPEVFNPDRFSEENKKEIPQYSYMPFGDGPRNCIDEVTDEEDIDENIIGEERMETDIAGTYEIQPNINSERFGIMQTKVALTSILRKYRVTLNKKTKVPLEMDPKSGLLSTKGGVWLNFEKFTKDNRLLVS
ncbi:hypothetical protein NQ314_008178 [Rhamnusium bicolor]|uniref:Cytochrome P450 n=1 Tax=Rhamnusium bicolor TaxID=1586634 RepID=A0AAV8YFH9_9CUCU|nr:hypothetical protein NQ314_008178 [Rhamnusium bicolor]